MAWKPDVDGNCGKSQLIDVASSQGPQSDASGTWSPGTVVTVSFTKDDCQAMPTAGGVDVLIRETVRGEESSSLARSNGQAAPVIAFGGEEGKTVAAGASTDGSDSPAVLTPALSQIARGASHPPSLEQPAAVAPDSDSAPLATAADVAAAVPSAVAGVKSEENRGKPLAVGNSWRTDLVGLAVLALAGQNLGQRWRIPALSLFRPSTVRRRKPVE